MVLKKFGQSKGECIIPAWSIIAIGGGVFMLMVLLLKLQKSKKPVSKTFLHIALGIAALLCVNILSIWTNVLIPISPLSLSVSGALGVPGVTAMLLIQCFFR